MTIGALSIVRYLAPPLAVLAIPAAAALVAGLGRRPRTARAAASGPQLGVEREVRRDHPLDGERTHRMLASGLPQPPA